MKINARTKISKIIKHNEEAIEAMVSINPNFKKLRNPLLRKFLAPRVTIEDAARIGKCTVADFFDKLSRIGFDCDDGTHDIDISQKKNENSINMNVIKSKNIKTLDVRPILQQNIDPIQHIMEAVKELPDEFVLEIINSFEPVPLIKVLNKKGFASFIETEGEAVHTYFVKIEEKSEDLDGPTERIFNVPLEQLQSEKDKFEDRYKEIDVCDLEMPFPMVTILNEMEDLPEGHALFVNHKKVPQFLLPELEERNYTTWIAEIGDENVKLLIHH